MGRNGMGKTTLLKCIMGLLPWTSGSVMFGGPTSARFRPRRGPGSGSATFRKAARSFRS